MQPAELMDALLALAKEAGLEVRMASGSPGEGPPPSGVCRVRGEVWVVLSSIDPVEVQLDVLSDVLRTHYGDFIESRYLSPAVRARLTHRHTCVSSTAEGNRKERSPSNDQ